MREQLGGTQQDLEFLSGVSGGGIPTPDKAHASWYFISPANATLAQVGQILAENEGPVTYTGSPSVADVYSNPTASAGSRVQKSVLNSPTMSTIYADKSYYPARKTTVKFTICYDQTGNDTHLEHYIGLTDAITLEDPFDFVTWGNLSSIFIGFQKAKNVAPGNLFLYTATGGVLTSVDTGVPIVLGKRYKCRLAIANGKVTAVIDGKAVAVSTTNVPQTPPLALGFYVHSSNTGAGTSTGKVFFEYLYGENATP